MCSTFLITPAAGLGSTGLPPACSSGQKSGPQHSTKHSSAVSRMQRVQGVAVRTGRPFGLKLGPPTQNNIVFTSHTSRGCVAIINNNKIGGTDTSEKKSDGRRNILTDPLLLVCNVDHTRLAAVV